MHNNKFLLIFIRDLEYTILVRIIDKFRKTTTFGRLKAYQNRSSVSIKVGKFQSQEVSRTPIPFKGSGLDIRKISCNSPICYSNIRLQGADCMAENFGLTGLGINGETR